MLKHKAFTLFETLIALIILSITIGAISKLFIINSSYSTYNSLQKIENHFYNTNNIISLDNIKLQHN